MTGPFETEQQARQLPAVQAVYEAFRADPGLGKMTPQTHEMLIAACAAAGVELGAYDRHILAWLAGWEPQTCAVIAGLISRAHEAGRAAVAEDTRRLETIRGVLNRFDWEFDDRHYALELIERIADGGQP
jgi:hypothetical protein